MNDIQLPIEKALQKFLGPVRITGAGTSPANGLYTDRGFLVGNDHKTYNLFGAPDSTSNSSIFYHAVTKWSIYDDVANRLYKQVAGDFKNPWDVTAWVADQGDGPAPAVGAVGIPIICAHETPSIPDSGSFLLIVAEEADWEEMIVNAVVPVRFELCTEVKDADDRGAAGIAHSSSLGKIIELFCDQLADTTLDELNVIDDTVGFTGWEGRGTPEPDGTTDTQIVAKRSFVFEAFWKP